MPTVFDQIYENLFGTSTSKEGAAFERLAAAVTALIYPDANVVHDQKLRGQFSRSLYQVDVLREDAGKKIFGEAKDYTQRGETGGKVGRGDLQKMGGALPDVGADQGVFFSATDYTREAKRYADAAEDIVGRCIELMHVRPSVEQDKEGRVTKIVLKITARTADFEHARWNPIVAPAGNVTLQALLQESGQASFPPNLKVQRFVDSSGNEKVTIEELTRGGFGDDSSDEEAHGCFWLPDHYIEIENRLVEVFGLEYKVSFLSETKIIEIVSDSEPMILVKSENGTIDKLITEKQLKRLEFDSDGRVKRKLV